MKYLVNIDLNKNQILNAVFQNLATDPQSPAEGQFYYDTVKKEFLFYNGSKWIGSAGYVVFNASTDGLVPKSETNTDKFLKGDGTWDLPPDNSTEYSAGNGITLDGDEFKLTVPTTNLSATSTNAASSSGHTHAIDIESDLSVSADATKFPTAAAVKAYVDGIIGASNAMVFKGAIDASTNPNYPAADAGHSYIISVAGKLGGASGVPVEVGDLAICTTDGTSAGNHATVGDKWIIIQANIDGAVTNAGIGTGGNFVVFDGDSGKVIKNSTYNASSFSASGHDHDTRYPKKYKTTLGGSTSQVITHSLNTRDVVVTIRETASPYEVVMADIELTSVNTLTVYFAVAPAADKYTITVIG